MRVAVLGTGTMGAPIARRLAEAGHAVRAWNRTAEKAMGLGAVVAASPAEAVPEAEVVLTMLADGPAVDSVMDDALPAMDDDAVWLQMSTIGADWALRLATRAAERGVPFVDAPVMGSRPHAEEGQLYPLVSGPAPARDRCRPLLEAFSRGMLELGDEPGLASRLKLVLNVWIMNAVESLAETFAFTEALDLDPRRFLEAIDEAPFDMRYAHWKGDLMLRRDFEAAFTLRLAQKDLALALEAARIAGVELPLGSVTYERFGKAIELGHAEKDTAAAYLATRVSQDERTA